MARSLVLQPWQLAAWQAGRLKAVWLKWDGPTRFLPWTDAGGPNECKHGYAAAVPCPDCTLPYAVGAVVEMVAVAKVWGDQANGEQVLAKVGRTTITSVEVRETASATRQEIVASGLRASNGLVPSRIRFREVHPWEWSLVVTLDKTEWEVASDVG